MTLDAIDLSVVSMFSYDLESGLGEGGSYVVNVGGYGCMLVYASGREWF